jgi:hypothetical protein
MLAQFTVLSRLKEPENSNIYSKMRVYDGENLKDTDPKAKSIQEYRDSAGVDEGMNGLSTRFAFKILSKVFNFDPHEIAANPVHLLYVLEQQIEQEQFQAETRERYLRYLKEYLAPRYIEFIGKEIQTAYLESYSEYGQNIFDRYVLYADFWIQDQEYRDPETGEILNRVALNEELEKIENRLASAIRRISVTRSSTSCCVPAPTTTARTRPGSATRNCGWSSRRKCSRTPKTCCRSSASTPRPAKRINRSTTISSHEWSNAATPTNRYGFFPNGTYGSGSRSEAAASVKLQAARTKRVSL